MKPCEAKTALNYGKYIALDTESTGFQPNDNFSFLLEIGAVKMINGQIVDRFDKLINPGVKISKKIQNLTGITDEMVEDKENYVEVLTSFRKWCDTDDFILIMHNATHDLKFLNYFGEKCGIVFNDPYIDTQPLAKDLLKNGYWRKLNTRVKENYKLSTLAHFYNIEDLNHHRADNDAELTMNVFMKLRRTAIKKEPELSIMQNWKYPKQEKVKGFAQEIKLLSICPWDKKKRIYINLSKTLNEETLFSTIYYDFDFNCWAIKTCGFPINSFTEIENKIKEVCKIDKLEYEKFKEKQYLNNCVIKINK